MLQFNEEEIESLRKKSRTETWIFGILDREAAPIRKHFHIQKTGLGTWKPFFACPDDSVPLVFDIADNSKFVCPACGKVVSGEPYYGAWWQIYNYMTSDACRNSGLLWLLTGDEGHFDFTRRILCEYADYYPDYEIHGNIPYNKPGRANAQVLTDAIWIKGLLSGYDFIRSELKNGDRDRIESRFLNPAADFFKEYRTNQLHNHELIVNSAIGILGLILGRKDCLDFAIDSKYGFHYQLEHGLLSDGFWFEGTTSYHFFAIEQVVSFEYFARHTGYSMIHNELLLKALKFPVHMVQPDGTLPRLNDIGAGYHGYAGHENIFELMYPANPCSEFAYYLERCYDGRERKNYYSFIYGADYGKEAVPQFTDYHNSDGSGISTLHGPDDRFLLFKHTPCGGEHDHYDRLGIHFMAFGKTLIPDLGTCFYGAPMHYRYYKNTGTHNTVCLNGHNQPPANCRVLNYQKTGEYTLIDAAASWDGTYVPLDSFVIKQWDDEAYKDAKFRRIIAWYGDFFVDIFKVEAPCAESIDWVFIARGKPLGDKVPRGNQPFSAEYPYSYLNLLGRWETEEPCLRWDAGDEVILSLHPAGSIPPLLLEGPDNPSTGKLSYLIERVKGSAAIFVNVISCGKGAPPVLGLSGETSGDAVRLKIFRGDGKELEFGYNLGV
jgi:hypothetical protein